MPTATAPRRAANACTVKLSDEYYDYLAAIAKDNHRSMKGQLEVIILDWMEANDWEQP